MGQDSWKQNNRLLCILQCMEPNTYIWSAQYILAAAAAAAAKSLQSCPTLCNPIDGSQPGSPIPGILQARILEWVAIASSRATQEVSQPWSGFSFITPFPALSMPFGFLTRLRGNNCFLRHTLLPVECIIDSSWAAGWFLTHSCSCAIMPPALVKEHLLHCGKFPLIPSYPGPPFRFLSPWASLTSLGAAVESECVLLPGETEWLWDLPRLCAGFPGGTVLKNPPPSAGDAGDVGSIPGLGRPWRRKRQPTPEFLPGKSHGQRSLAGSVHEVTKSWTWLSMHTHTHTHAHTHTHTYGYPQAAFFSFFIFNSSIEVSFIVHIICPLKL